MPRDDDSYLYIYEMCWMTDNRLFVYSNKQITLMDIDVEHKTCNTSFHQYDIDFTVHDLSSSGSGECYLVPYLRRAYDSDHGRDHVLIFSGEGDPERWAPVEVVGNIQTVAINKNFIVVTGEDWHVNIYVYNRNKTFLYEFPDHLRNCYSSYLTEDNYLWCKYRDVKLYEKIFNLNTKTSIILDSKVGSTTSGFGRYVMVNQYEYDDISTPTVYLQDGTFSHGLDADVPMIKAVEISIRERHEQPPLMAIVENAIHDYNKIYYIDD